MSADKSPNIQNDFFNRARKDGGPVTIYLTNGKKLTGRIRAFDKYTVIVESNRIEQMLFKHAISTVAFNRPAVGSSPAGGSKPAPAPSPPPAAPSPEGE
jgi:host factor-I protein